MIMFSRKYTKFHGSEKNYKVHETGNHWLYINKTESELKCYIYSIVRVRLITLDANSAMSNLVYTKYKITNVRSTNIINLIAFML